MFIEVDLEQPELHVGNNCNNDTLPKLHVPLLATIRNSIVKLYCGPSKALEQGSHGERQTETGPCSGFNLNSIPIVAPITVAAKVVMVYLHR